MKVWRQKSKTGRIDSVSQAIFSRLLSRKILWRGVVEQARSVFFVLPAAQQTLCVCVRIASECNRTRNEPFLLHIPEKARRHDFSSIITNVPCPCNYFFPPLLPFVSFLPPLSISIRGGDSYFLLSSYSIDNW